MPVNIRLAGGDAYLKEFFINDLPDLCMITGINGSGKSRLLNKLKSENNCIYIDGTPVDKRRILPFNAASFQSFQTVDSSMGRYRGNTPPNAQMSDPDLNKSIITAQDTESLRKIVREYIYKSTGKTVTPQNINEMIDGFMYNLGANVHNEFAVSQITDSLASSVRSFVDGFAHQAYNDSIAANLQSYYHKVVEHELTGLAKASEFNISETEDLFNIENMINEVLLRMKLDYEVSGGRDYILAVKAQKLKSIGVQVQGYADDSSSLNQFRIKLRSKTSNNIIDIDDLSSGEKELLSIASIIMHEYKTSDEKVRPLVLLLDEPDSHLHPDFCRLLVEVIDDVFVKQLKIKIIMTTHSPVTLAVSGANSVLKIAQGEPTLTPIDVAIQDLLANLPHIRLISDKNRYIFVEASDDGYLYNQIYTFLSKENTYVYSPIFIPSAQQDNGANKAHVLHIVENLPNSHTVFGIMDWDLKNKSSRRIVVSAEGSRYSIENLIYDPLVMLSYFISRNRIDPELYGLPKGINVSEFLKLNNEVKTYACKTLIKDVLKYDSGIEKVCKYNGDHEISIPVEYLQHHGHSLEDLLLEKIIMLNKKNQNRKRELVDFMNEYPSIIPIEFKQLFDKVLGI